MSRLGAIIAGGQSKRFGSDKAMALLEGKPLMEHIIAGLQSQVDAIIICGRDWPGSQSIMDRPAANLGPLGGINAALYFAQQNGFETVFTMCCDVLPVPQFPHDLPKGKAAFIADHYLFGIWPASLSSMLDAYLIEQPDRSMRAWIAAIAATELPATADYKNLNTAEDLAQYGSRHNAKHFGFSADLSAGSK